MSTITAPHASKWYHLLLDDKPIEFPDMGDYERLGSPFVDHVPNPRHVVAWALKHGHEVDEMSLERLVGRWELEATKHYDNLFEVVLKAAGVLT